MACVEEAEMIKSTSSMTRATGLGSLRLALHRVQVLPWQIVVAVSLVAGIGSGWTVLARQAVVPSPFLAATTMMLVTFAGWYVWALGTHLANTALFGRHSSYQGTLDIFAKAYAFQALSFFTFTSPLGWIWTWIAAYLTVVAWAVLGPRHLGMRTWQAIVSVTLGLAVWLACLVGLTMVFTVDGLYMGIGAFLA